jgi:2-polyprenyl-6-methoxyphenol hydroxylase-like FAD-dependent oxidoreductase
VTERNRPVLIVGAGAGGPSASTLLAHQGIQSLLIDRRREIFVAVLVLLRPEHSCRIHGVQSARQLVACSLRRKKQREAWNEETRHY